MFRSRHGLSRHMKRSHSNDLNNFKCVFCSKMFTEKDMLDTHIKNKHIDEHGQPKFNLLCIECGVTFDSNSALLHHNMMYPHSKIPKRYKCPLCQLSFKYKYYLDSHMRSVHILRRHHCIVCQINFRCKYDLYSHLEAAHGGSQQKPRPILYTR